MKFIMGFGVGVIVTILLTLVIITLMNPPLSLDWHQRRLQKTQGIEGLSDKLFVIGGNACQFTYNPFFSQIVNNGRKFDVYHKSILYVPNGTIKECYRNCANYFFEHSDSVVICAGYVLGSDGIWFNHFWCWNGEHVVECTFPKDSAPEFYYGAQLSKSDSMDFTFIYGHCNIP